MKLNAILKKPENFEINWKYLNGMGWHKVQWPVPKISEMQVCEILNLSWIYDDSHIPWSSALCSKMVAVSLKVRG